MMLESGGSIDFVDLTFEDDMAEAFGLSKDKIFGNMKLHLKEFVWCTNYT